MVAINHLIVYIPFYACSLITFPFAIGYRTGQAIALMIALDQFIAVWKPFLYNKFQKSVKFIFNFEYTILNLDSIDNMLCNNKLNYSITYHIYHIFWHGSQYTRNIRQMH
jgi:hypothetical protein